MYTATKNEGRTECFKLQISGKGIFAEHCLLPTVLGNITQPRAPRDRNPSSHAWLNIPQEFLDTFLFSLAHLSPSQTAQLRIKLTAVLGRCRWALGPTIWDGETSFSEDLTKAHQLGAVLLHQAVLSMWLLCRVCWWAL